MSTSSPRFPALTSEFPAERETLVRLRQLVSSGRRGEMTLDHLATEVSPHSIESFVRILERLVRSGVLGRVYRLESPSTHGKIDDYKEFSEIPQHTTDWHVDAPIDVTPSDIHVIYKIS